MFEAIRNARIHFESEMFAAKKKNSHNKDIKEKGMSIESRLFRLTTEYL